MTKTTVVGVTGSLSGATSIFGSWQVCHSICLGLIGLLSVIGITITGMPLLFLTTIAVPVWIFAAVLFAITYYLYLSRKCLPTSLVLFYAGLLIAGIPFPRLQGFTPVFWTTGGVLVVSAIILFVRDRRPRGKDS